MNRISAFILKTPRTLLFSSCLVKTHYQAISVQSERDSITRMLISHFQLSQLWDDFFSFIGHPASNAVIVPELRVLIKINKSASGRHMGEGLGGNPAYGETKQIAQQVPHALDTWLSSRWRGVESLWMTDREKEQISGSPQVLFG